MSQQSAKDSNVGLWAHYVASSTSTDLTKVPLNNDLYNRMVVPACFKQCARTDVDIVFMNEMECTYKCIITYKQSFG